MSDFL